jgi:hypothetical protein
MEGFKNTTRMQCFKEGGFVTKKESKSFEKKEQSKDIAKDTKMIKKGVRQHESALHKGEPKTELKLKQGGRAKKDCGTVRKYQTGGMVENQYAAKKTDKDIKDIANTKRQKPAMLCGGKSVQKYNEGKMVKQAGATQAQQKYYQDNMDKADKKAKDALYEAVGSRGDAARKGMEEGRMDPMGTAYKKGGKAKKC